MRAGEIEVSFVQRVPKLPTEGLHEKRSSVRAQELQHIWLGRPRDERPLSESVSGPIPIMSIMFATPMYGNMCTRQYMQSMMRLQESLLQIGIAHDFNFMGNESLVQRARNVCVQTFMASDHTHLMFIDADLEFTPQNVADIWNLEKDVGVGVYPMKRLGSPYAAWKDGRLIELRDLEKAEPFQVDYAGTGFMMIKRSVFELLEKAYPETKVHNDLGEYFCHFQVPVHDEVELSEDYDFCRKWRAIGGEVWCDPGVRLVHYGLHGYDGT